MSKFKARPELRALPDPEAVALFAAGAESRATTVPVAVPAPVTPTPAAIPAPVVPPMPSSSATAPAAPPTGAGAEPRDDEAPPPAQSARRARRAADDAAPWEKHDRTARPLSGINVRLNDYEHELLRFLASSDGRSIQQTIKRLLIPTAETAARRLRRGE